MKAFKLLAAVSVFALAACSAPEAQTSKTAPIVGGDRDAHGCIGSAGYAWCTTENACVRSWELAAQRGFANTQEAFASYCKN